jgi:ADP-ribosyl-[dinitrogen reductase] hydrolase
MTNNLGNQKSKVLGAIFGQAIGDAIGHPVEFKKTHKVTTLEVPNKFTDDTQMFCALGEAMLDSLPHADEKHFMEALTHRFLDWRKNPLGGGHRAPGGTCMEGVRKLGVKIPWIDSGKLDGKGNGTAMRSGVVGAVYWQIPEYAFRIGALQSVNTHNNLEAILGAGVVSYLVAASIRGDSFPQAIADVLLLCARFNDPTIVATYPKNVPLDDSRAGQSPWRCIAKFGSAYALGVGGGITPKEFAQINGDDFSVTPAVSAAIYYNTHSSSFGQTILDAANFGDDADTIAAISGTIAGARYGIEGIQADWIKDVELSDYLMNLANRIWETSLTATINPTMSEMSSDEFLDLDHIEF